VGRDPIHQDGEVGSVTLGKRLARKSTCSILVVPRTARCQVHKILVPLRFSDCSVHALETAGALAAKWPASIIGMNVYQVHAGYRLTGMTYEQFAAKNEQHAREEYARLLESADLPGVAISDLYKDDPEDKPASHFAAAVFEQDIDLVVVGARGRTAPAGVLLGRVTEGLMMRSPAPVLAVKKKDERIGFLEAFLTGGL